MCVLFVAWHVREDLPLVVAANRDESHSRPADPAHRWTDCRHVYAGRDRQAGGTWMGASKLGRWASVTNVRHPDWMDRTMPRSRGSLVADFLCGDEPPAGYAARVAAERGEYAGFNLLFGDLNDLYYASRSGTEPRRLAPGLYGLSNAALDDPWPKVARGGQAFRRWIEGDAAVEDGLALLRDTEQAPDEMLPETGVGLELERLLSPLFIIGGAYGTRSSTLLTISADGDATLVERSFGPAGAPNGTVRLDFLVSGIDKS
jgi:uncharacterized protein with NRDE domain